MKKRCKMLKMKSKTNLKYSLQMQIKDEKKELNKKIMCRLESKDVTLEKQLFLKTKI